MRTGRDILRAQVRLVIELIGFAIIVAGITVIYWPAGAIIAGVLLVAFAQLLQRGE
jgi:hypothetical protein